MKKINTKTLVTLSVLIAVAMILSYIEAQIPAFTTIPGVKMGLSNIATVFALYVLGWPYAIIVSVIRVVLSSLLFGKITSLIYGLSGAALALTSMILLKKFNRFSTVGVSVVGGVTHNIGQIIAVCIVMGTSAIALNLVILLITGTIAGVVIGVASGTLIERTKKYL